jgi:hypothetical protein
MALSSDAALRKEAPVNPGPLGQYPTVIQKFFVMIWRHGAARH